MTLTIFRLVRAIAHGTDQIRIPLACISDKDLLLFVANV